jgi:hydroxymethylpyrimidine pyrophosphatase-like HAD family hydrolase
MSAAAQRTRATVAGERQQLVVHNLLSDLESLAPLLPAEIRKQSWLDAYLLAAGMAQIADDYLHPEIEHFDRAASYLTRHRSPLRRAAGMGIGAVASVRRAASGAGRARRRAAAWRRDLADLVDGLADAVAAGPPAPAVHDRFVETADVLAGALGRLPKRLRRDVLRVPSCFHDLDQRPADLARLAERLADRWSDRGRPMLAVGVRTSGSYMAPLLAAHLRAAGFVEVGTLTIRPGRGLLRDERSQIAKLVRGSGLALLTDDPPVTGASIAASAGELERAGIPSEAIVLVLQLLGSDSAVPPALRSYESEVLPAAKWAVSERFAPKAVEEDLSSLFGPDTAVTGIEPLPLPEPRSPRSHKRARFLVRLRDASGEEVAKDMLVEGVGVGYLGAQEIAAADVFGEFAPETFGCLDGVLYREWMPDDRRVGSVSEAEEEQIAARIAAYVTRRRRAMPVDEDVSMGLDDKPPWDVASSVMSNAFGRVWPLGKILLTDQAAKRLMKVADPSVIDGNMDLSHWFYRNGSSGSLVKVDVGDQLFSNFGLRCFDPAFDLAGVTAREPSSTFPRRLRRAYADLGNEAIDEERWLLYELAHLWGWQRSRPDQEAQLRRARSRSLQRYFADVYLADLPAPGSGPLCALDIDGVLETEHLGFPSLTPSSALALRALRAHGLRPVLVSGRSLDEVAERCRAYGLAGGVAEYGAALYDAAGDTVEELVPSEAADELDRLRACLEQVEGISVDADFRRSVRAFLREGSRRVGLGGEATVAALHGTSGIRAVQGDGQTDFVSGAVDKGSGLRALASRLGAEVALAIGDTRSDLPMAAEAARTYAPGHADRSLRDSGFDVMKRPYQAGLAQAVGRELGHAPGECDVCGPPAATPEREILLAALAVQERGTAGMPLRAMKLAARTRHG